jgi:hypothetical protein
MIYSALVISHELRAFQQIELSLSTNPLQTRGR